MRNELQWHKRSDKVKWVLTGIMFFLAFVMIAGLALQVFGTGKTKPSEWFKKQDSEQTEQLPVEDEKGDIADGINTRIPMSISRSGFSAMNSVSPRLNGDSSFEESVINYRETLYGSLFGSRGNLMDDTSNREIFLTSNISDVKYPLSETNLNCVVFQYTPVRGPIALFMVIEKRSIFPEYESALISDMRLIGHKFNSEETVSYSCEELAIASELAYPSNDYFTIVIDPEGRYSSLAYESSVFINSFDILFDLVPVVPLPSDPVKEGYHFIGWYYDEAYTQPYNGEPIYADTQLYAKFEINQFTVTFDSDGGSDISSQTVNWNTSANLTIPVRDKYSFKGWFLPNGTQYIDQPIKENTILTAHWQRNFFYVTFETDGGNAVDNIEVDLNSAVILPTTEKTGYIFKGWFLSDGTEYINQPVTEDITLTACWEIQTFTVIFYVDGEVFTIKTVEYGQGLAKLAETENLKMLSVRMASGMPTFDDNGVVIVTENCSVDAQEMSDTDKVINTVKQNKWAIIGGVVGGIALIAIIAAVCGGVKWKRKR